MVLVESIRDDLIKVFTPPQTDALVSCFTKAYDALATRADVHDLRVAMTELADQQQETSAEVRALAEQQKETSAEVRSLAEQQKKTSAAMQSLADQQQETSAEVRALADQQRETSAEMRALAEQQKETSAEMRSLAEQQKETSDTVRTQGIRTDTLAGWALEFLVGKHLPAYVGRRIRRCRIVGVMDVIETLEQDPAAASLTRDDFDDLQRADLIASGIVDSQPIYLIGEVSYTGDNDDVLRAARRAKILRKAGQQAQPFVACDAIPTIPAEIARNEGVWVIVKGRLVESVA